MTHTIHIIKVIDWVQGQRDSLDLKTEMLPLAFDHGQHICLNFKQIIC